MSSRISGKYHDKRDIPILISQGSFQASDALIYLLLQLSMKMFCRNFLINAVLRMDLRIQNN